MVVVSEAYLQHIEKRSIQLAITQLCNPITYKRYVDDSHSRFESKEKATKFLNILNQQCEYVKFTIEFENEEKGLNFST